MPVFILLFDGFLDFGSMNKPSLGHEFAKFNWVVEDLGPFLDGCDVFVHTFAGLDGVWKHPDDLADILNTSDEFQVFEIVEGLFSFCDDWLLALEAALEFDKVVMSGKAVNESSSEVRDCI